MNDTVIKVNGLSKRYRIGVREKVHDTLAGTVADLVTRPAKNLLKLRKLSKFNERNEDAQDVIWALNDISFEVGQGEIVGIVGRNGSGKSTLLKVLSRITDPTRGQVELSGRVSALLEVGTGFHPELTGRENIYLNGSVLGMRKKEINQKFDEIVDFSEIEKFIDTPVKRYSTGMSVRLAFSVAAHLDPEVLLVDEVLAVGDLKFQEKCIGKMRDVTSGGRTVLFVSHNMGSVQKLCNRTLFLHEGRVLRDGPPSEVVSDYLSLGAERVGERVWTDIDSAPGDDSARMHAVRILDHNGTPCTSFDVMDSVFIRMEYWVLQDLQWLDVSFYFYNERGELIFVSVDDSMDSSDGEKKRSKGFYSSTCEIPPDILNNGQIFVMAGLANGMAVHTIQRDVVMFNVLDSMSRDGARGNYVADWPPTAVRPRLFWTAERISSNIEVSEKQ